MSACRPELAAALDAVVDPCSVAAGTPLSLAEMGLLREVREHDGDVLIRFSVTGPGCTYFGAMGAALHAAAAAVPGVRSVHVELDAGLTWHPGLLAPQAAQRLAGVRRPADLGLTPA